MYGGVPSFLLPLCTYIVYYISLSIQSTVSLVQSYIIDLTITELPGAAFQHLSNTHLTVQNRNPRSLPMAKSAASSLPALSTGPSAATSMISSPRSASPTTNGDNGNKATDDDVKVVGEDEVEQEEEKKEALGKEMQVEGEDYQDVSGTFSR